jgi:hypothetical protein
VSPDELTLERRIPLAAAASAGGDLARQHHELQQLGVARDEGDLRGRLPRATYSLPNGRANTVEILEAVPYVGA